VEASSGKTVRHRLNRGGDRQANNALWVIALTRLRDDPRTRAYAERRTKQGQTTTDIMRCLKRYLARELLPLLKADLHDASELAAGGVMIRFIEGCSAVGGTRRASRAPRPQHPERCGTNDHPRVTR
jgi:Transposase IS116/IS110/IS902 family